MDSLCTLEKTNQSVLIRGVASFQEGTLLNYRACYFWEFSKGLNTGVATFQGPRQEEVLIISMRMEHFYREKAAEVELGSLELAGAHHRKEV